MADLFARGNRKTVAKLRRLRATAQRDKAPRVALRIQGIMLSLQKRTTGEIAGMLQVNRTSVYAWVRNWNEFGEEGLKEGHRCGRPSQMDESQRGRLYDIVESGPVAYGLNTGVWTSPMVAQVISDEFGVEYHQGHVRKVLKKLGFSVQCPTTSIVQAQKSTKNKWVRYTYPNLKKSAGGKCQHSFRGRGIPQTIADIASYMGCAGPPAACTHSRATQYSEDTRRRQSP